MNYSYNAALAPTLAEAYIQRKALKNVEPSLCYLRDAQKVSMPKNNGKHVRFFRYTELPPVTKPLYEGVTPDPQNLEETAFEVMTKNYGAWMDYTDEIDLWHVDKKTDAMGDRLIRQARLSIDTVGRDAICAGLNVMYPGSVTKRASLSNNDILNYAVIKKAVRNLKRKGAQPFADGFYHAIIDHDTYYDLTQDTHWENVSIYQDDRRTEKYLLGTIYNVKFYESDNGKTFTDETYLYGTTASLLAPDADSVWNEDERTLTVTASLTSDVARELTGKMVYVAYTTSATRDTKVPMCIERVYPEATTAKIKFRWSPGTSVTTNFTYAKAVGIIPSGGGTDEVHATIIYGQDAFGMVGLGTTSEPNIRIIAKAPGSAGTSDPLDQRGSLGWKVPFFAVAVLQDDFIVRIEHGVTQ